MVISRKQGRMLLYAATNYEARHRNNVDTAHRAAKDNLAGFLSGPNRVHDTRSRDMSWCLEWLQGENAYGGAPTWNALYQQFSFALGY